MNEHLKAIRAGVVTKSNVIGIRKAINAEARRLRGYSVSRTAPKLQGRELADIEDEIKKREPRVTGALHDSGLKLLRSTRYRRQTKAVAHLLKDLSGFRLVGFHRFDSQDLHSVPMYRAECGPESFVFYNIPWQSGGNGPVIVSPAFRDPVDPMTESEAQAYAPQWGSYMTAGDPGAIMYSAIPPETAEHRADMVDYIKTRLYPLADEGDAGEDEESDYEWNDSQMLRRLVAYLEGLDYPATCEA